MAKKSKSKLCTQCRKRFEYKSVMTHKYFPFCSEQCKLIDLGAWFNGEYGVVEDLSNGLDMSAGGLEDLEDY